MNKSEPCPVCQSVSNTSVASLGSTMLFHIICPRCGQYQIEYVAKSYLNVQLNPIKVAVLSHAIRKMQKNSEIPLLEQLTIAHILQNPIPKPSEQINILITWLGNNLPGLGENLEADPLFIQAEIGAINQDGVLTIISHLAKTGILIGNQISPTHLTLTLTIKGWEYYEKLKRRVIKPQSVYCNEIWGQPN